MKKLIILIIFTITRVHVATQSSHNKKKQTYTLVI